MKLTTDIDRRILARIAAFASQHPAMLLTVLYLLISLIGLSFSWAFYARFDIDYFDYAEIGDFLLAAFREQVTFLFALTAFGLGAVVMLLQALSQAFYAAFKDRSRIVAWLTRLDRKMNPWGFVPPLILLVLFYCVIFVTTYAFGKADGIRDGKGEKVTVHYADPIQDGRLQEHATLLGTTASTVFLFDHETRQVHIVPFDAIVAIEKTLPENNDKTEIETVEDAK